MSLFGKTNEEISLECWKELAEGCKRHPAYRVKVKPRVKCVRCLDLWDVRKKLLEFEDAHKLWVRATLAAESKRQRQEAQAREDYYNSPG